ncbi:MAG TPA: YihY/virulence factor BrkB family protein [Chitinophagaceae bacterium]|nr:YihY/virulence factor BrkB family protein [Chitinophagaceae bacterium]
MQILTRIRDSVAALPLVGQLLRKSKTLYFPGARGIPIYDVVQFFIRQMRTVGMSERASSIAFNFLMAIPPAIIFLFTLIPFMPIPKRVEEELYLLIKDVIPGQKNNSALINFLRDFINNPRSGLLSLGFILSLFFSSNAIIGIMRCFDKNYIGFTKRSELYSRWIALKITMILFLFILLSVLVLIAREEVLQWLGITNKLAISIITNFRWVIIVLLFFACISYIYRHAPAVHKKWKMINPGSILATFLMILFTMGFSWYVNNFGNYNELYGSIGTILILMLLIYFNSLVLIIGFELNVSISSLKKIADERNNNLSDGKENPA